MNSKPYPHPRRHDLQEKRFSVGLLIGHMADLLKIGTAKLSGYEMGRDLIPPETENAFLAIIEERRSQGYLFMNRPTKEQILALRELLCLPRDSNLKINPSHQKPRICFISGDRVRVEYSDNSKVIYTWEYWNEVIKPQFLERQNEAH